MGLDAPIQYRSYNEHGEPVTVSFVSGQCALKASVEWALVVVPGPDRPLVYFVGDQAVLIAALEAIRAFDAQVFQGAAVASFQQQAP